MTKKTDALIIAPSLTDPGQRRLDWVAVGGPLRCGQLRSPAISSWTRWNSGLSSSCSNQQHVRWEYLFLALRRLLRRHPPSWLRRPRQSRRCSRLLRRMKSARVVMRTVSRSGFRQPGLGNGRDGRRNEESGPARGNADRGHDMIGIASVRRHLCR